MEKTKGLTVNLKVRRGFKWYLTMWKIKRLQCAAKRASSLLDELADKELEVDVVLND